MDACEKQRILNSCHSDPTSGHLGTKRTIKRIRERFTWKGLNKEVFQLVMVAISHINLLTCFYRLHPVRLARKLVVTSTELHLVPVITIWYHVAIDFIGPISPISLSGNRSVHLLLLLFSCNARNTFFNRIDYTIFKLYVGTFLH